MTREEIKDFLDVSTQEQIIETIFNLESELLKTQQGLDVARTMISNSVSRDRYNDIIKQYNDIFKKYNEIMKRRK